MKENGRGHRVADHLRERLADIIRAEMRDPRIGMVSVNDVRVSRDMSYADIFVSALGADTAQAQRELITVLEHAAGFLRSAVARDSTMRSTPKLRFHYDELIVEGARIESLIRRAVDADKDSQRRRGDGDGGDPQ
ncbi:MAG TPA: 30S ribosome-binding factor RbfA [Pseudomonadales bacterium]|nr:30S ribosome-binding factor RbfA [Pseudomonadales bacterium]